MNEKGMEHLRGAHWSPAEQEVARELVEAFSNSADGLAIRLHNFTRYIRRQELTRLLVRHELFKRILPVKGSIVECGVFHGFGLMAWLNLSAVLEPVNFSRRIYGFDTFKGFPAPSLQDNSNSVQHSAGELRADSKAELLRLIGLHDRNRYLGHVPKVELIDGDATETIPRFLTQHPHTVVSLLFLDFDLYEPTRAAIECFLPRMPKGAIIAFDEVDNPLWPGETRAMLDSLELRKLPLRRLEFDPVVAFAEIE